MSNDKELLELAAKAVGYEGSVSEYTNGYVEMSLSNHFNPSGSNIWNPLHVDGDALRLAVDLKITHGSTTGRSYIGRYAERLGRQDEDCFWEAEDGNPYAATRRAIVRAAAEIGKGME